MLTIRCGEILILMFKYMIHNILTVSKLLFLSLPLRGRGTAAAVDEVTPYHK